MMLATSSGPAANIKHHIVHGNNEVCCGFASLPATKPEVLTSTECLESPCAVGFQPGNYFTWQNSNLQFLP